MGPARPPAATGPSERYFDPDGEDGVVGDGLELVPDEESDDELPGELAGGGGVGVIGGDADGDGLGRSLVLRSDGP